MTPQAAGGAPLKIATIGAGREGEALGTLFAKPGYPVMFSSRHPEELKDLVASAGPTAQAGIVEQAVAFGDVILLVVPYTAVEQIGKVPRESLFPQDEAVLPLIPCATYMISASPPKSPARRITDFLRLTADPSSIFRQFWNYVDADPAAQAVVKNADLIELQWFEMAATAVFLRRRGVSQPIFGFYHDVMSQKLAREF